MLRHFGILFKFNIESSSTLSVKVTFAVATATAATAVVAAPDDDFSEIADAICRVVK